MKDYIIYDTEIIRCIPPHSGLRDPALEYCAGWDDHAHMGISTLCAWDERSGLPRVFCADNLEQFKDLIQGRLVVGFNNISFDDRLLAVNGITVGRSWDLCRQMRRACGEPEEYTAGVTKAGRRLDDIAHANLALSKSMNGELAPVAWQRGRFGSVVDYCLRDVMIVRMLLEKLPEIVDPVTGQTVKIAPPEDAP